jgi:hypothetical protein
MASLAMRMHDHIQHLLLVAQAAEKFRGKVIRQFPQFAPASSGNMIGKIVISW